MKKHLKLVRLDELEALPIEKWDALLVEKGVAGKIDSVNWTEFSHCPETSFYVAYTSSDICISYHVKGQGLKALFANDQEPVWQDSCVEFFCKRIGQEGYFNFEFNCIGTCLSAIHVTRENRTSRSEEQMQRIRRSSSVARETFAERDGEFEWQLTVAIPLDLLGLDGNNLPEKFLANFYKCGDETKNVHYVSWAPIAVDKPDFHRPDFFGELYF